LPNLEKCYLRHPSGLNTVRHFFTELRSGGLGRGIIGCDSWAWFYLKHVIGGGLPDALVQRVMPWVAKRAPARYRLFITATIPGIRLIIISSAIVLILSRLVEPKFENLIALPGAAGLALQFAMKDYVASLIAGIVTIYEMPYRTGDGITIDGAYGEVKSINMRNVEITTPDDTVVVIPHLKLWNASIFNAIDGSQNLQCVADFYLHPCHSSSVMRALHDVGLTSSFLQIKKPIHVVVHEKPWGTHYRLKAYPVDPGDQFRFISGSCEPAGKLQAAYRLTGGRNLFSMAFP
jgi:hypothetical protein